MFWRKLLATDRQASVVLIRLMVGAVFLSEGVQKFLYPGLRGSGRFQDIGIPSPEFFGPFVGSFEVICGGLVLLGLLTRGRHSPDHHHAYCDSDDEDSHTRR